MVPSRYLGTAYAIRSVLGFGTGIVGPVVFGVVLDHLGMGVRLRTPWHGASRSRRLGLEVSWRHVAHCGSSDDRKAPRWLGGFVDMERRHQSYPGVQTTAIPLVLHRRA